MVSRIASDASSYTIMVTSALSCIPGLHPFNRALRPPRRLVTCPARLGSSAITSRRASGVIRDHAPISSIDRRHPVHSRLSGWMTQTLTQGLSISARDQMWSVFSGLLTLCPSYVSACPAVLAGYTRRPRDQSPLRDVFVSYPPQAGRVRQPRSTNAHPRR